MSNIYIQEPPALGKVVLKTTVGDIDIELWTKETPKACRNFIQLCMEGYYNGTIFHRLVPDFIVQGGDPNGDGTGGESIYGAAFKDEFHSRLRFNRRGLVAMANAGKDDNGSQFFFTLNTTPELQNKHTIFGKVTGETIFNMLKLAEGLTDADDRPMYPHKIVSAEILLNPFEDIAPRVMPKESKIDKDAAKEKKKKDRVAVKNFGLLSFGDEAEEDEDEAVEYRGKPKSTHDLLDDPKLSKRTAAELHLDDDENENDSTTISKRSEAETQASVNSIKEKLQARKSTKDKTAETPQAEEKDESSGEEYYLGKEKVDQRRKETAKIRDEIKQMKKDMKSTKSIDDKGKGDGVSGDAETSKNDNEMYEKYIREQEKYKKLKENVPKKGAARESFTLELLAKFQKKLSAAKEKQSQRMESESDDISGPTPQKESEDTADNLEGDDWLAHELHFEQKGAVLAKDASTKGDDWFDIYDPRNPLNKRKREEGDKNKNKLKKTDKL